MIAFAANALLFELPTGERVPFTPEMISVEVVGEGLSVINPDVVRHAAASVVHYFKHDLGRETVSLGEFAEALEKVLQGLGYKVQPEGMPTAGVSAPGATRPADLHQLAREAGDAGELVFFQRLREALRAQLRRTPERVVFSGLRACVKLLTGARRWSPRCQWLQQQILAYLRDCLGAETPASQCVLVVE
ncbi:MAG: hypothetical protein N3I86_14305 [Verrucomicrobiae bacterium]|nr:hypothetical protein [Verrucomicrobiae bacterium]